MKGIRIAFCSFAVTSFMFFTSGAFARNKMPSSGYSFGPDGSLITHLGSYSFSSNGTTYTNIGSYSFGSDGTVITHMGGLSLSSGGGLFTHLTNGSSGSMANHHGNNNSIGYYNSNAVNYNNAHSHQNSNIGNHSSNQYNDISNSQIYSNSKNPCYCGLYNGHCMIFRKGDKNALNWFKADKCEINDCQNNFAQIIVYQCGNKWWYYNGSY